MKKIYLLFASLFMMGATQINAQCTADFQYNTNNLTVNFQDSSFYSPSVTFPLQQNWNFGDSNSFTGVGTNPSHTYAAAGTYRVTLMIYDSLWTCFDSTSKIVTVTAVTPPSACNASFTKAKDSSVAYGVVLYNTSSNLSSHAYTWDFGDGITGSGRTPIHQYQSFGTYIVCLTITDTLFNCTSTYCDTVGMDTLGNLKSGFGLKVQNPLATSLKEVKELNAVRVYPNPATNEISLDLTAINNNVAVRILDLSGRLVIERNNQVGGNIEKLDISNLTSGIYFVTLFDGATQVTKKFIKN